MKFVAFVLGLMLLVPSLVLAQCANASVGNAYAPACAAGNVGNAYSAVQSQVTTYTVPVQVVSPQVTAVAPSAQVSQNTYSQQVVGTAMIDQGYAQPTISVSPPLVAVQAQAYAPVAVQRYNAGVGVFQGSQNYVQAQAVRGGYSNYGVGANVVNVSHRVGVGGGYGNFGNVSVQHTVAVPQGNFVGAGRGGLFGGGIFGGRSKTVTKTVTKTRGR